jgi:hypothetical protein
MGEAYMAVYKWQRGIGSHFRLIVVGRRSHRGVLERPLFQVSTTNLRCSEKQLVCLTCDLEYCRIS